MYEITMTRNELKTALANVDSWAHPEPADRPLLLALDKAQIYKDALGVVLIIGAWNYPVNLTLTPLISALAAGNCAVIKPSEVAPNTAELLAKLIPKYLSSVRNISTQLV